MKNNDFIRRIKEEIAPLFNFNTPSPGKTETQQKSPDTAEKLVDIDSQSLSDQFRSKVFVGAALIGGVLLLFKLFGQTWTDQLLSQANQNYIGIAIAGIISLIGVSIVSGILKLIFGFIKLTPAFKDIATQKTFKPIFRAAYGFLMIYLTIFVFLKLMTFMAEQDIFEQINRYSEEGFEFTINTDEGAKTIEFKDGQLNIETR